MNLQELKTPFAIEDIEWRMQQAGVKNGNPWGMALAYVTNRAIMDRLDEVCGPENWKNSFLEAPNGGTLCTIYIRIGDEWVGKTDGAENTEVEAVKGGLSGAMKRAGVQWGIGRYLYHLETGWAKFADNGKYSAKIKTESGVSWFKWNPPDLPDWAIPNKQAPKKEQINGIYEDLDLKLSSFEDYSQAAAWINNDVNISYFKEKLSDEELKKWSGRCKSYLNSLKGE